jgi:hypothetical protein
VQHVAYPDLVGAGGLETAVSTRRGGRQRLTGQAGLAQVLAHGALGKEDPVRRAMMSTIWADERAGTALRSLAASASQSPWRRGLPLSVRGGRRRPAKPSLA